MSKQIEYKKTRLSWCPEIPKDWDVVKLSYDFSKIGSGTTPQAGNLIYYQDGEFNWLQTGDLNDGLITETSKKITQKALDDYSTLRFYSIGSLVIAMYGATIGKSGILGIETTTNQACCVLAEPKRFNTKFIYYWFHSNKQNIISLSYGGGQPNISQELIRNLRVQCPPLEQQQNIAKFLDLKIAELDKLISKKRKLIDCLKEERIEIINQAVIGNLSNTSKKKPSGFEWVPTIPIDWTLNKIKNVAKIFGRIGYRGYQTSDLVNEGEGAITLSPSNMKEFEMDFTKCTYLTWLKYDESPEIQIEDGDILFVKTGSTYGKTSLVKNLPEKATINPQLLVFKEVKINSEFFYFVLLSQLIQSQVSISVIGGTIPTISQEKIGNYYLFVPPIKEQDEIVVLINKHLEQTNLAINKIEQEIDLINEYRAALINEIVTGKITLN